MAWSANAITGLGSALMWALLAGVAVCPSALRAQLAPLWVALLWSYCILDHVDGCRARRRRTSCAWGEFLDHALDAGNASIAVIALVLVSGGAVGPKAMAAMTGCVGIATAAVWLEQKARGEFRLGAIGPVEAVLAAGVYITLWRWPAAASALGSPLSAEIHVTRASLMLVAGAGGSLVPTAISAWRSREIAAPLLAAALAASVIMGVGFASHLGWGAACLALAILTAEYSARVITSHLTGSPMPWPDVAGPALLVLAAAIPAAPPALALVGVVWLAARAVMTWRMAVRELSGPAA